MAKKTIDVDAADAVTVATVEGDSAGGDSSAQATEVVATVAMYRDYDELWGGPTHADVHPDEVELWLAAAWQMVVEPGVNEPD